MAEKLKKAFLEADLRDGIADPERRGKVPGHSSGVNDCWELRGPPSRYRYLTLKPQPESAVEFVFPRSEQTSPDQIIRSISEELFKCNAFRAWLMTMTTFLPVGYEVEARRFRPGLDYTLATSDNETRLDVVLGLTPPPPTLDSAPATEKKGKGKGKLKNMSTEDQDFWPMEWGGSDVSTPSTVPFLPFLSLCFASVGADDIHHIQFLAYAVFEFWRSSITLGIDDRTAQQAMISSSASAPVSSLSSRFDVRIN